MNRGLKQKGKYMSKIVMGYWDCQYCGSVKIKGTLKTCPCCNQTNMSDIVCRRHTFCVGTTGRYWSYLAVIGIAHFAIL